LLNTIAKAQVTYDLGEVTTSINFNAPIVLLDSDDNEISNPYIKTNVNEVKVRVPVTMKKTLPLVAEYTATDLDKYEYFVKLLVNETEQTVVVVGDPDVISSMESVKVNVGDITGYTGGEFTVADMILDDGVWLFDESITSIKCTVDKKLITE
jgi:YbbR domain-containing protein